MFPAALLLLLSAIAFRLITGFAIVSGATWLSNFAPLAAVALCSAAYLPLHYKWSVPLIALLVSDLLLNAHYGAPLVDGRMVFRYGAFALVGCLGFVLQNRASLRTLVPASLAGSCLFYLVTNTAAWLGEPGYAKNLAGFTQALTVGLPAFGATPTWMFFRNSLLSDAFFTTLFVACMSLGQSSARTREREPSVRTA